MFHVHDIFLNTCASSSSSAFPDATRAAQLLAASREYRTLFLTTARALEENEGCDTSLAEAEELKVAHAVWQAAEVAFLREDESATQGLLEWLRDNFVEPVNDRVVSFFPRRHQMHCVSLISVEYNSSDVVPSIQVAQVLERLRGPSAAVDPSVAGDVWDITAKLTVEGQVRGA